MKAQAGEAGWQGSRKARPRRRARKWRPGLEPLERRSLLSAQPVLTATGTTIAPLVGQPFTSVLATFSDSSPPASPSAIKAIITWGDGHTTTGTVSAAGAGSFAVAGSNTYDLAATFPIGVLIVDPSGAQATAASKAIVANAPVPFTGQLDPLTDTGPSHSDGITRISQPNFLGTAEPFSIVRLFAQRSDQIGPVLLGQTAADSRGQWTLTVGPLLDGRYVLSAVVIDPAGIPGPLLPLTPGGQLVIDTAPPRVVGVSFVPGLRSIVVVYRDDLSGMDLASITNPQNYTLVGTHLRGGPPALVTRLMTASVLPTDPQAVLLTVSGTRRFRGGLRNLRIIAGGVADLAGNPLAPSTPLSPGLSFNVPIPAGARRRLRSS